MNKMNKKEMVELEKRTAEQKRRLEELRDKLAAQRLIRTASTGSGHGGGGGGMTTYNNSTYTINASTSAPLGGGSQWQYNSGAIYGTGSFTVDATGTPCTVCGCAVLDRKLHEKWHAEIQKVATEQAVSELQEMIQDIIELSTPE